MLRRMTLGGGRVDQEDERARLYLPATPNPSVLAQLDDYTATTRLTRYPPSQFSVWAQVSTATPVGSFGFGFWNQAAFSVSERQGLIFRGNALTGWQALSWLSASSERALVDTSPDYSTAWPQARLVDWHLFTIQWTPNEVVFSVDGQVGLRVPQAIAGPLGTVLWMERQGPASEVPPAQWLDLKSLRITGSSVGQ